MRRTTPLLTTITEKVLPKPMLQPQLAFAGAAQDHMSVARQRLNMSRLIQSYSRLMFSEKKEGDDQPPKGFEKFYKKKEGGASTEVKKEEDKKKTGEEEKAQKKEDEE